MPDLHAARITVMGLGHFGGGAGVLRWLVNQGAQVLLTDLRTRHQLAEPLKQISDLADHIQLHLGGHDPHHFTNSDLIIASPAAPQPWNNPYLQAATHVGVPITTEIRLVTERLSRQRVIGITGSSGKSTTAAMLHHILTHADQRAHLGGNFGGSLLNTLNQIHHDDWIVLELSSFMLYWLGSSIGFPDARGWSPHAAALTNLHPNHLDWHGTLDHYHHCKHNIFRWQTPGDLAFTAAQQPPRPINLKIPGRHNELNAALALHIAQQTAGIDPAQAARALTTFTGLPHRLALIAEHDGMRFYDDSKATTPAATGLAVRAFNDPSRVHLIAGGYDKGADLSPISQLGKQLAGLYGIGATGTAIVHAAGSRAVLCQTLENAVQTAITNMRPGDVLLLSPGCASWDQFDNYQHRGIAFANAIQRTLNL